MENTKKTFLLYADWDDEFEDLENCEAGELIKGVFQYVNGTTPTFKIRELQRSFNRIKKVIDRNTEAYAEKCKKRAEAGRKGGLKSGQARSNQSQANEAIGSFAKQNEANEADNVNENENVNDNVNDNVILLEKETKEENQDFPSPPISDKENADPIPQTLKKERKKVAKKKENIKIDDGLEMPDDFRPLWKEWKEYRKDRKKKPYAALKWEQIAVNKFLEISNNDSHLGKLILKQTYENNYEGLFPLKHDFNHVSTPNYNTTSNTDSCRNTNRANSKVQSGPISFRNFVANTVNAANQANSGSEAFTLDAEIVQE